MSVKRKASTGGWGVQSCRVRSSGVDLPMEGTKSRLRNLDFFFQVSSGLRRAFDTRHNCRWAVAHRSRAAWPAEPGERTLEVRIAGITSDGGEHLRSLPVS